MQTRRPAPFRGSAGAARPLLKVVAADIAMRVDSAKGSLGGRRRSAEQLRACDGQVEVELGPPARRGLKAKCKDVQGSDESMRAAPGPRTMSGR